MDGSAVAVGLLLGDNEGMKVGNCLGFVLVGSGVGVIGVCVGLAVLGGAVGSIGTLVGSGVGVIGICVGFAVLGGAVGSLGTSVGFTIGVIGICVGFVVLGDTVGSTDIAVGLSVGKTAVFFGFQVRSTIGNGVILLLEIVLLSLNLLTSYFVSGFVTAIFSLAYSERIRIGQFSPLLLLLLLLPKPNLFLLCNSHAVFLIQLIAEETRWYTPGIPGLAQPYPNETTPTRILSVFERSRLLLLDLGAKISGPPLSPWHASFLFRFQFHTVVDPKGGKIRKYCCR
jgi:hypothetical protein